jgi:DnaJ-class molecular chaperone
MAEQPDDPEQTLTEGVAQEPVTRPDLKLVACANCRGRKLVLEMNEWATMYRAVARRCGACNGSGQMTRLQFASWHAARRQGR